jgi:hypothetical protein
MDAENHHNIDESVKELALKLAQEGNTEELHELLLREKSLLDGAKDWVHQLNIYMKCLIMLTIFQTGDSLLAIACWNNKYETAKMLVDIGADLVSTPKLIKTILRVMATTGLCEFKWFHRVA